MDYRSYRYRDGDVVYCDIPYENCLHTSDNYGGGFNNAEFYAWAKAQPFPVYFSSYPLDGFTEVWRRDCRSVMNSGGGGVKRTECLYVT